MNIYLLHFFIVVLASTAHSQANTRLSNLVSPTAVNVDLLPGTTNVRSLGSGTKGWKNLYTTAGYFINNGLFLHNRGVDNTFVGDSAGTALSTGYKNTALGERTLNATTTGFENTAIGAFALNRNTSGYRNSAMGVFALFSNTSGILNTANGYNALVSNTTGKGNTAQGAHALFSNTTGYSNTAIGLQSLYRNTTGSANTAVGDSSLLNNATGLRNVGLGAFTLYRNNGIYNTAIGFQALRENTTGSANVASGFSALYRNTDGSNNTAVGNGSLTNNITGDRNTALGYHANVTSNYIVNDATAIGVDAFVDESNKVRIGNSSVTKIGGQVGWTTFSDGRYKQNIKQDVHGLDFINSLRPITYTVDIKGLDAYYDQQRNKGKETFDEKTVAVLRERQEKASEIIYNGFVAQEVEEAAQKLNYEFSGVDKPIRKEGLYGLRYGDFVVPLVKAVQELSAENKELKEEVSVLKSNNEQLEQHLQRLEAIFTSSNGGQNLMGAYMQLHSSNPSSGSTLIRYGLPAGVKAARIDLVNMKGQVVKSVALSSRISGQVTFNTTALAAGSYLYTLWVDGNKADSQKLVIAR